MNRPSCSTRLSLHVLSHHGCRRIFTAVCEVVRPLSNRANCNPPVSSRAPARKRLQLLQSRTAGSREIPRFPRETKTPWKFSDPADVKKALGSGKNELRHLVLGCSHPQRDSKFVLGPRDFSVARVRLCRSLVQRHVGTASPSCTEVFVLQFLELETMRKASATEPSGRVFLEGPPVDFTGRPPGPLKSDHFGRSPPKRRTDPSPLRSQGQKVSANSWEAAAAADASWLNSLQRIQPTMLLHSVNPGSPFSPRTELRTQVPISESKWPFHSLKVLDASSGSTHIRQMTVKREKPLEKPHSQKLPNPNESGSQSFHRRPRHTCRVLLISA